MWARSRYTRTAALTGGCSWATPIQLVQQEGICPCLRSIVPRLQACMHEVQGRVGGLRYRPGHLEPVILAITRRAGTCDPTEWGAWPTLTGSSPATHRRRTPAHTPGGIRLTYTGACLSAFPQLASAGTPPRVKCALRATSHAGQFRDLNPAEMSPSPLACEALFANRGGICSPSFSKRRFTRSLRPPTSFWHG